MINRVTYNNVGWDDAKKLKVFFDDVKAEYTYFKDAAGTAFVIDTNDKRIIDGAEGILRRGETMDARIGVTVKKLGKELQVLFTYGELKEIASVSGADIIDVMRYLRY